MHASEPFSGGLSRKRHGPVGLGAGDQVLLAPRRQLRPMLPGLRERAALHDGGTRELRLVDHQAIYRPWRQFYSFQVQCNAGVECCIVRAFD